MSYVFGGLLFIILQVENNYMQLYSKNGKSWAIWFYTFTPLGSEYDRHLIIRIGNNTNTNNNIIKGTYNNCNCYLYLSGICLRVIQFHFKSVVLSQRIFLMIIIVIEICI